MPVCVRACDRLLDSFNDKNHLCLVFELLDMNLYELLKQNQFRGLPLSLIRYGGGPQEATAYCHH